MKLLPEKLSSGDGVAPSPELQEYLESKNSAPLKNSARLADLLRRPELSYDGLAPFDSERPALPPLVREQVEIRVKYDGYIRRQLKQVEQFRKLEQKRIPEDLDYEKIPSLRLEAVQKLKLCKPISIGQASRISGVSPADLSVLLVYLEQRKKQERKP